MKIIKNNINSRYGVEFGFNKIKNADDFISGSIPIADYSHFQSRIEAIREGEERVLTEEKVLLLEPTGGSLGGTKLIPYTASLKREFQRGINPWLYDLYTGFPSVGKGKSYWSITPVIKKEEEEEGMALKKIPAILPLHDRGRPTGKTGSTPPLKKGKKVKAGFEDDSDYLGLAGRLLQGIFAVPPAVKFIGNIYNFRFITSYFLLICDDLSFISIWNPTFLLLLTEFINNNKENLIKSIRDGILYIEEDPRRLKPFIPFIKKNPRRAKEIENIFAKYSTAKVFPYIWQGLALISCWTHATAEEPAQKLKQLFPQIPLQGKGLLSTEGIVSIPFTSAGGCIPAYRSHFLEFLPINESKTRLLHQLEKDGIYTVIITTGGGFYRYNTHDRIKVTGFFHNLPLMEFVGREKTADMVGEKLEEEHINKIIWELKTEFALDFDFIMLAPSRNEKGSYYTLFIQPRTFWDSRISLPLLNRLEEGLQENFHYQYARNLGQLLFPRLFIISGDCNEVYFRRCMEEGQKMGDIKPILLDSRTGWEDRFEESPPS